MALPASADVAIIGGGILGASVAWHLARLAPNLRVVLVEREQLAAGATSRAAALLTLARDKPLLTRYVRATYAALGALETELGESLDLHREGSLYTTRSPAQAAALDLLAETAMGAGVRVDSVGPEWVSARLPWLDARGATRLLHMPEDGWLDPYRLALAYLRAARRRGVSVHVGTAVTGLLREGSRIYGVRTGAGEVTAEVVVDAAGAWSNVVAAMAGAALPLAPVRSHYWISAPDPAFAGAQPFVILPDAAAYARPEVGALLFGVREAQSVWVDTRTLPEDAGALRFGDDPDGWVSLEAAREALLAWLPALDRTPVAHYVAGLSTYTPDGMFVLGAVPGASGLIAASGCCGAGIACSGGIGQVVAEMCLGLPVSLPADAFAPGRFGSVAAFSEELGARCAAARSRKRSG